MSSPRPVDANPTSYFQSPIPPTEPIVNKAETGESKAEAEMNEGNCQRSHSDSKIKEISFLTSQSPTGKKSNSSAINPNIPLRLNLVPPATKHNKHTSEDLKKIVSPRQLEEFQQQCIQQCESGKKKSASDGYNSDHQKKPLRPSPRTILLGSPKKHSFPPSQREIQPRLFDADFIQQESTNRSNKQELTSKSYTPPTVIEVDSKNKKGKKKTQNSNPEIRPDTTLPSVTKTQSLDESKKKKTTFFGKLTKNSSKPRPQPIPLPLEVNLTSESIKLESPKFVLAEEFEKIAFKEMSSQQQAKYLIELRDRQFVSQKAKFDIRVAQTGDPKLVFYYLKKNIKKGYYSGSDASFKEFTTAIVTACRVKNSWSSLLKLLIDYQHADAVYKMKQNIINREDNLYIFVIKELCNQTSKPLFDAIKSDILENLSEWVDLANMAGLFEELTTKLTVGNFSLIQYDDKATEVSKQMLYFIYSTIKSQFQNAKDPDLKNRCEEIAESQALYLYLLRVLAPFFTEIACDLVLSKDERSAVVKQLMLVFSQFIPKLASGDFEFFESWMLRNGPLKSVAADNKIPGQVYLEQLQEHQKQQLMAQLKEIFYTQRKNLLNMLHTIVAQYEKPGEWNAINGLKKILDFQGYDTSKISYENLQELYKQLAPQVTSLALTNKLPANLKLKTVNK